MIYLFCCARGVGSKNPGTGCMCQCGPPNLANLSCKQNCFALSIENMVYASLSTPVQINNLHVRQLLNFQPVNLRISPMQISQVIMLRFAVIFINKEASKGCHQTVAEASTTRALQVWIHSPAASIYMHLPQLLKSLFNYNMFVFTRLLQLELVK